MKFFDNKPTNASHVSTWMDTTRLRNLVLHVSWTGAGTPNGALTLEFSNDPQAGKDSALGIPAVDGTAKFVDVTSGVGAGDIFGDGLAVDSASGDTIITIPEHQIPAFVRVRYTRTSGGAATGMNGWLRTSR